MARDIPSAVQPGDGLLLVRPSGAAFEQLWVEVQALSGDSLTLRLKQPVQWPPGESVLLLRKTTEGRLAAPASVFGGTARAVNAALKGEWRLFNSRRAERYPTALQALIRQQGGSPLQAQVVDISFGGMQLTCEEPVEVGVISVQVIFRGLSSVVDCEVRHARELGEGRYVLNVKFGELVTPQAIFVRRILDDHREALGLTG